MSVRTSLRTLERRMERTYGGPGTPCRCQGPLVVLFDEARGTQTPERVNPRCEHCNRHRTRINVRIVKMPLPGHAANRDNFGGKQGTATFTQ